jgi:protein FRG1
VRGGVLGVWLSGRVGIAGGDTDTVNPRPRYLGCDKFGVLSAHREAISAEESFLIAPHPTEPGAFSIQTSHSTYLTTSSPPKQPSSSSPPTSTTTPTLRADSPTPHPIHVRMQALHKTRLSASKEAKAREVISRKELEEMIGRRLEDEEVRRLKRARRDGSFHEAVLDVRVKGKHDKFAC